MLVAMSPCRHVPTSLNCSVCIGYTIRTVACGAEVLFFCTRRCMGEWRYSSTQSFSALDSRKSSALTPRLLCHQERTGVPVDQEAVWSNSRSGRTGQQKYLFLLGIQPFVSHIGHSLVIIMTKLFQFLLKLGEIEDNANSNTRFYVFDGRSPCSDMWRLVF